MKMSHLFAAIFVPLILCAAPRSAWPAADQLEEIRQEQTKDRQKKQLEDLKRQEQLENLKRDQQIQQVQRELEQIKQSKGGDPQTQQQAGELQRR